MKLCYLFSVVLAFIAVLDLRAQHSVTLSFTSEAAAAKQLGAFRQNLEKRGEQAVIRQLQADGARHVAVVKSSRSALEWKQQSDVVRAHSSPTLTNRGIPPNDPDYLSQWNFQKIELERAWEFTTGGTSSLGHQVVIGVIELLGFGLELPELAGQYFINPYEIPDNGIDDDNNGFVDDVTGYNLRNNTNEVGTNNHGAKVSALLAAKSDNGASVAGTVWDAKLLPIQVGGIGDWLIAIDYLTTLRQRFNASGGTAGAYICAINGSLGATGYSCDAEVEFNDAVDRAGRAGLLSVSATDNILEEITQGSDDFPSTCPSDFQIIVTASDRDDEIFSTSRFSQIHVDLAAPGSELPSIAYSAIQPIFSGTSAAVPHVAGVVALAHSLDCKPFAQLSLSNPGEAAVILRDAILESVDPLPAFTGKTVSNGRLNAFRALETIVDANCTEGDVLVRFSESATPPMLVNIDATNYLLQRIVSDRWNVALYQSDLEDTQLAIDIATQIPDVIAVEGNVRFDNQGDLFARGERDFVRADYQVGAQDAWDIAYKGVTASASPVVTAVLDQNFSVANTAIAQRLYKNPREQINGMDDDGNGFIDDVSGVNLVSREAPFRSGTHGRAVAALIVGGEGRTPDLHGLDRGGRILPLQGASLAHWIEGADYSIALREDYNLSAGSDGALITSYVVPQVATRALAINGTPGVLAAIASDMFREGILCVSNAASNDNALDFALSVSEPGWIVAAQRGMNRSSSSTIITAPGESILYSFSESDTLSITGGGPAVALTGGAIGLAYQIECSELLAAASAQPQATAQRVLGGLMTTERANGVASETPLRADYMADKLTEDCAGAESQCRFLGLSPNPIRSDADLRLQFGAVTGTTTCTIQVVDALGRKLFDRVVTEPTQYNEVVLNPSSWASGVYFVRMGSGGEMTTQTLVKH